VFRILRTLTTWHCPHLSSTAAERRPCSNRSISICPARRAHRSSGSVAVGPCWGRQTDRHRPVTYTPLRLLCGQCQQFALLRLANYQLKQLHGTVIKTTRKRTKTKPDIENNSVRILRAGFKGGCKLGSCPGASTTKVPPQKQ